MLATNANTPVVAQTTVKPGKKKNKKTQIFNPKILGGRSPPPKISYPTTKKAREWEPNLLHALDVIPKLGIKTVGNKLHPFAILSILLSVQEPGNKLKAENENAKMKIRLNSGHNQTAQASKSPRRYQSGILN